MYITNIYIYIIIYIYVYVSCAFCVFQTRCPNQETCVGVQHQEPLGPVSGFPFPNNLFRSCQYRRVPTWNCEEAQWTYGSPISRLTNPGKTIDFWPFIRDITHFQLVGAHLVGIQSYSQIMIGVSTHLLIMVFRFRSHSHKVIGCLGEVYLKPKISVYGRNKQ